MKCGNDIDFVSPDAIVVNSPDADDFCDKT